jgi:hypothetical protein
LERAWRRETDIEKPGKQVPLDRDEPPERCQSFSDHNLDVTVDIYELEEMIAAKERDDLEKIGISVTSSRSGKLQLEVNRVALHSELEPAKRKTHKGGLSAAGSPDAIQPTRWTSVQVIQSEN